MKIIKSFLSLFKCFVRSQMHQQHTSAPTCIWWWIAIKWFYGILLSMNLKRVLSLNCDKNFLKLLLISALVVESFWYTPNSGTTVKNVYILCMQLVHFLLVKLKLMQILIIKLFIVLASPLPSLSYVFLSGCFLLKIDSCVALPCESRRIFFLLHLFLRFLLLCYTNAILSVDFQYCSV